MFANKRMAEICRLLQKNGSVLTSELSEKFGVSIETIRRDLLTLECKNKLVRVHGGAVPTNDIPYVPLEERIKNNKDKKHTLAKTACKFIENGDIIALDSGSTAMEFAEELTINFSSLTVITNSVDVFECLRAKPNFKIIFTGGTFIAEENAFYGIVAENALKQLHYKKAFVFPTAVSLKQGISECKEYTAKIQKEIINRADKVFALADSDKFEKSALFSVMPLNSLITFVTDTNLSEDIKKLYTEKGFDIKTE